MRYGLGCSDEDISYLQALHEQIIAFTKSNVADIPLFLSWWTEKGSTKSIPMPSGGNAITIDTIHRSKGLGYKAVIIPYCNWSLTTKTGTVVWSGAEEDSPPAAVGQFPVHYKKAMENSHFAADYYREYVMSHVDNLNLFYVALTRAREELHIMLPVPGRTESERIGTLLDSVISRSGGEARLGDACGKVVEGEEGFSILFGCIASSFYIKPQPRTPDTLIFRHLTASRHDTKRGGVHRGSRFDAVFTFSTNIRKIIFTEIRRCMSVQRAGARLRSDSSEANI